MTAKTRPAFRFSVCATLALCAQAVLAGGGARAATIDVGNNLELRWDNTAKLSALYGLHSVQPSSADYCAVSPAAGSGASGRCGYDAGFLSGRLDWLSEVDLGRDGFGLHASVAAWYDAIDNSDEAMARRAPDASERGGKNIELSEAFVHGTLAVGDDQPLSFRLGRHTLIWGESLYFAGNGIAAGQAPIDGYAMQSANDYQSSPSFLPVGQASLSWRARGDLTVEAYYQFEWRRSRLNPEDAYTDTNNSLGSEQNRMIGLAIPGRGTIGYDRLADQTPGDSGQYGLALHWRRDQVDYGLYGLRFNAKTPNIYYYPGPPFGTYRLEFAKGIEVYGVSATGALGDANFGLEISGRRNMPLVNGGVFIRPAVNGPADNDAHPFYPVGDTLHAQLSWIYPIAPGSMLPGGAKWSGEFAANRLLGTSANESQIAPGRTRTAAAMRTVFEPQFFQVLPRLDLTTPLGLGYTFLGLSTVDPAMNRGTGDIDFGIAATLDQVWKASVTFTHYFGASKAPPIFFNAAEAGTPLADWDSIGIMAKRSF